MKMISTICADHVVTAKRFGNFCKAARTLFGIFLKDGQALEYHWIALVSISAKNFFARKTDIRLANAALSV